MTPQPGSCGLTQVLQEACACIGGHLRDPNEQNTQQSPAFGRNTVLQLSHS